MKKAFTVISILGLIQLSFAQIVSIEIGASGDISGTQYDITSGGGEIHRTVWVTNLTPDSMLLRITRERIVAVPSWEDRLCWGVVGDLFGACYNFTPVNPWITPITDTVQLQSGEAGLLEVYVEAIDPDYGCGLYRYRIMRDLVAIDSIDFSVCKTIGLNEFDDAKSISIFPNPASSSLKIHPGSLTNPSIEVIDILGNVALPKTRLGDDMQIDVSNFRNGIYFVRISSIGTKIINRKLLIERN